MPAVIFPDLKIPLLKHPMASAIENSQQSPTGFLYSRPSPMVHWKQILKTD